MIRSADLRHLCLVALVSLVAACGGSGGVDVNATLKGTGSAAPASEKPATQAEASRFLGQATFGGNNAEIGALMSKGYLTWLAEQYAAGQTSHVAFLEQQRLVSDDPTRFRQEWVFQSFWRQAIAAPDQLRQRVAYALSQIFVVSMADGNVAEHPRGVAAYMDMLSRNAFGNFRTLLREVSLSPMMGIYLSHLRNRKEDPATGRVPDENYAREVMQLFTIGLVELNPDGTPRFDTQGRPLPTYTNDDVTGLAKVFTGFSWIGPADSDAYFNGWKSLPERDLSPMQAYPKYHSSAPKQFLGTTVAAQSSPDPTTSLDAAIDRLFWHPNVGPFIGRQLIQRLVTSNPSPAYVARVAAAFADNGEGVRGDMRAVVRAVLFDPEARDEAIASGPAAGKLREPVLRVAHWLRVFGARSASGNYLIGNTDSNTSSIGQAPMYAPSVFNYYRPGYVPPNTAAADAGLVAPELQITHESSVAGYLNTMRSAVEKGFGSGSPRDVQPDYSPVFALADSPPDLIESVNLLLLHGRMSTELRTQMQTAIESVAISTRDPAAADRARRNRAYLAVFLALASPEYLVLK